jgi:L-asparagine transporter-like permease
MFLTTYAIAHATLVALASLALNYRFEAGIWAVLYLPLMACGFVVSVLIYWARRSYERPKSGAIRLSLAILVFLNVYIGVLLFSAVKLGFVSNGDARNSYAPYILLGSILGSVAVYFAASRSLKLSQSE